MNCGELCGHTEGMRVVHLKEVQSNKSFLNSPFLPLEFYSVSCIFPLWWEGDMMENALTQLAWRQRTQCCPFLSAVGIKLRTLPCIDLQRSFCLGVVRFDKLFASLTGFISKAVLVWLSAGLFFVILSDGKWTRDILMERVRRFTN